MRWVWRAESGASALEYAGLVVIAAALITALVGFGLPTVKSTVGEAVCVVMGKDGCKVEAGGPEKDSDSPGEKSPGTGEPGGGDGEDEGSEGEQVAYDPEKAQALEDADRELEAAKKERKEAQENYENLGKDLLKLVSEIIGIEDARKCVAEGDIEACIWTAVGLMPWGKAGKVISKIPKAIKFFNKWRKLRKLKNAANTKVSRLEGKSDEIVESTCPVGDNSFPAGTPVLMADGNQQPIEKLASDELVHSSDPLAGDEGPRAVERPITENSSEPLVEITVSQGGVKGSSVAQGEITATANHPFWVPELAEWVQAADLSPGMWLRTSSGTWTQVSAVRESAPSAGSVHNLSVATPNTYYVVADGQALLVHNKKKKGCPPEWVKEDLKRGREFDDKRKPEYTKRGGANEVHVEQKSGGSDLRLDSYIPGKEIVSRKHTNLAKIKPETAKGYLREVTNKYGPGTKITATPSNKKQLSKKQLDEGLNGEMYLEVPEQKDGVPKEVLDEAEKREINIVDETGKRY